MLRKISFNQIEEKSLENSYFTDIYDFDRLVRVKEYKDRAVRYMEKQDKQKRRKQREPLNIGEKVLLTAERLKKKDMPGILYKSSTQSKSFSIEMKFLIEGLELIMVKQITVEQKKDRFFRQELFAPKGQFE